jgi:mannose-6-phosphate isomerase
LVFLAKLRFFVYFVKDKAQNMEEPRKLYPLKFLPIGEDFSWGGKELERKYSKSFVTSDGQGRIDRMEKGARVAESHEIADLGYRDSQILDGWLAGNSLSEVMDMYLDRIVGERVFEYYGRQFPLSVKLIDAEGPIPLMVHPDDETAGQRYDFLGKAKMWYVLDTRPEAWVSLGFSRDTDAAELYASCLDGSVKELLNTVKPRPGDCFAVRPGTVHAASGVILLEVSEASPLDFCLYGWGRDVDEEEFDGALGLVEALDFIDYKAFVPAAAPEGRLAAGNEFIAKKLDLKDPLHIMAGENGGFAVYVCVAGEASIQVPAAGGMESTVIRAGETVLVPAEVDDFYLVPRQSGTELVEVLVEREEEADAYIDPSAEPELPGEGEEYKFNSVYGRFSKD